jgi:O-antigen/teichoic acid export membrane protein
VPYQANTFLATIKDDGLTAVLGGVLGATGIGYLGWAQKWGYAPLRFFMDHVLKITFPAFARMQDNPEALKRTVTRSIFFICFLVFPMLIGLLSVAPILVNIIPRYGKWTPALLALSLIGINTIFAAITTPLTNLLNSIGKIKITFKLMIMWTTLTWMLVPILAIKFGVNGAALGYALVSVSSIVAIFIAKKYINFSLWDSALKPLIASGAMGIVLLITRHFLPDNWITIVGMIVVGLLVYIATSYLLLGSSLIDDIKKGYKTIVSK